MRTGAIAFAFVPFFSGGREPDRGDHGRPGLRGGEATPFPVIMDFLPRDHGLFPVIMLAIWHIYDPRDTTPGPN